MFTVNFINNEDGGKLGEFETIEAAVQFIQNAFCDGDVDEGDILQIWSEDETVDEYTASDFDC